RPCDLRRSVVGTIDAGCVRRPGTPERSFTLRRALRGVASWGRPREHRVQEDRMLSRDRRRGMAIALAAGVLIATSACSGDASEEATPTPTAVPTTAEPTTPDPTPEPTEASPTPEEIPNAGEEVPVTPGDAVPFYDFSQGSNHPPHVADIQVAGVEWDWSPPEDASALCEYDPANGRYV